MNRIITDYYPVFTYYQALRDLLMALLTDDDLSYSVGGANPTLGTLCREIGEVEHAYIQSFKTFTISFDYRNKTPDIETNVAALSAWYAELDRELRAAVEALTNDDLEQRVIDRDEHFKPTPLMQLQVYNEALLIFYGKVSVYLKVLGKALPEQWQEWIG